jgi:hypothetical protein
MNHANSKSKYRPELKILCGEHPAFVDSHNGQHPMHAGPTGPSAQTDEDPTVLERKPVRDVAR